MVSLERAQEVGAAAENSDPERWQGIAFCAFPGFAVPNMRGPAVVAGGCDGAFRRAQQHHPAIGGEPPAIKRSGDFLAHNGCR